MSTSIPVSRSGPHAMSLIKILSNNCRCTAHHCDSSRGFCTREVQKAIEPGVFDDGENHERNVGGGPQRPGHRYLNVVHDVLRRTARKRWEAGRAKSPLDWLHGVLIMYREESANRGDKVRCKVYGLSSVLSSRIQRPPAIRLSSVTRYHQLDNDLKPWTCRRLCRYP